VWFYLAKQDISQTDYHFTREEFTAIVLKDGEIVGWGQ
jgi:hypothetical protein